jgi:hypothetical protein
MPTLVQTAQLRVDTPAMSQLLDQAEVLGRLTDGIVFVVGAPTPFTVAERAIAIIGKPILSALCSRVGGIAFATLTAC